MSEYNSPRRQVSNARHVRFPRANLWKWSGPDVNSPEEQAVEKVLREAATVIPKAPSSRGTGLPRRPEKPLPSQQLRTQASLVQNRKVVNNPDRPHTTSVQALSRKLSTRGSTNGRLVHRASSSKMLSQEQCNWNSFRIVHRTSRLLSSARQSFGSLTKQNSNRQIVKKIKDLTTDVAAPSTPKSFVTKLKETVSPESDGQNDGTIESISMQHTDTRLTTKETEREAKRRHEIALANFQREVVDSESDTHESTQV